jgi:hypothetical protein
MKLLGVLVLVLVCAGCHESKVTEPSPVDVSTVNGEPLSECQPFEAGLSIDVHLAKRTVFSSTQRLAGYELGSSDGSWKEHATWPHLI